MISADRDVVYLLEMANVPTMLGRHVRSAFVRSLCARGAFSSVRGSSGIAIGGTDARGNQSVPGVKRSVPSSDFLTGEKILRIVISAVLGIGISILTGCKTIQTGVGPIPSKHFPPNPPPATYCDTANCYIKLTVSLASGQCVLG